VSPALRLRRRPGRGGGGDERAVRTARAVAAGGERLWPWWLERQLDPASPAFVAMPGETGTLPNVTGRSWTLLGTRAGRGLAAVDPRGLVTPVPGGWSLDWWVGADDRWHLPSREVAVRQRSVDGTPVVETAMRVPGGDVVATAWAAQAPGAEVVVVEIANATPVPVALALAVRPYDGEGVTTVRSVALGDGGQVDVDGRPALVLPRPPARAVLSAFAEGDPVAAVAGGLAEAVPPGASMRCRDGLASGAFVVPLTHGTSVRVVLAMEPGAALPPPASLPPAEAVARGWRLHADAGARLVLPDDAMGAAVRASRCSVLLASGTRPDPLPDLDGFPALSGRGGRTPGLLPAATLRQAAAEVEAGDERALERLQWALDVASPTGVWPAAVHPRLGTGCGGAGHDVAASDELLWLVRRLLVCDEPGGLVLCPVLPEGWRGQALEVHDLPTASGTLSFAVRWHGSRPALLWEVEGEGPVHLRAPGLDPAWSSTERRGEALLTGADVPGGSFA
jgi:hypothetical protein